MSKIEFPRWIYPDAPETTRGKIVHDAAEEAAYMAECQVPVINGDTTQRPLADPPQGDDAPAEETIDEVRAKLDAAGIQYHHAAGLKKLQALLPKA